MENEVHLGEKVRGVRRMKGMKQETLAKGLGIVQQNVSKMEKKKRIPDERLEQAAQILGITVEELKNFDHKGGVVNNFCEQHDTINYNINPLEKIIELYDGLMSAQNTIIQANQAALKAQEEALQAKDALIQELQKKAK